MPDSDTQNLSFGQTSISYGSGANITVGTPPEVQEMTREVWTCDRRSPQGDFALADKGSPIPNQSIAQSQGDKVILPEYEQSVGDRQPWTYDFGFKNDPVEVEYEGEIGLICEGWASKYNEEDASGEYQAEGAFNSIGEEWGAQQEPLVLYNHATDHVLGARRIGRGIGYKLQPEGLYVKVFVPRDAAEGWKDKRAKKRFGEVYQGIKSGIIRAFSVGGGFTRFGKKLARWSTLELSITPTPCLASATFALGSKALVEKYGAVPAGLDDPPRQSQAALGMLTRAHWNTVMGLARQDGAHGLHDHLLEYQPAFQGKHDSEDCALCADRRDMMGIKATPPEQEQEDDYMSDGQSGIKAVWSAAQVNDLPDSCFAYVESGDKDSEGKTTPRSKRHLPYKGPDGKPDAAHTRNALARLNQADIPAAAKASALKKLKAAARTLGIEVSDDGSGGKADDHDLDYSGVLQEATALLAEFQAGIKSGRRHSKETRKAVQMVVDHLTSTFGLGPAEDNDPDEATEKTED